MPRLPTVNGDDGNWGTLLNEFLEVAHNDDGTLSDFSVNEPSIGDILAHNGTNFQNRKDRAYHLNDDPDIDPTGSQEMGSVITAKLAALASAGVTRVYCAPGSTYLVGSTIDVPAHMTIEGPAHIHQGASANQQAVFKANADNVTIMRLTGSYIRICGLKFHLNQKAGVVGIRPNRHVQVIEHCLFGNAIAGSTGIKGGGILYLSIRDCAWSDGFQGRGIDLLDSYADNPSLVYYGVNVGWFERLILGASEGGLRAEGIFTVRDCNFEASYTNPAVEVSTTSAVSMATIDNNYFEIGGSSQAILLGAGATATITNNRMYGVQAVVQGFGIKLHSYAYGLTISNNLIGRFESGIILTNRITNSTHPSAIIGANQFSNVTTNISGIDTSLAANAFGGRIFAIDPNFGFVFMQGAINGTLMYYTESIGGSSIDLGRANIFHLNHAVPTTLAASNINAGMQFILYFQTANITLPNNTWHVIEGTDVTPQAGTSRRFFVDFSNIIRELTG